ncbi:MAG: J domain-containing protein [Planctomycetota bacterium]
MHPDLHRACIVLFGPAGADPGFLQQLSAARLRQDYRRRVKQCHPDRAAGDACQAAQLTVEFKRVWHSYQSLLAWVARPQLHATSARRGAAAARRRTATAAAPRRATATPGAQRARQARRETAAEPPHQRPHGTRAGCLPHRRLFLAEYLYRLGRISYRQMIAALVWQRRQRPLFGQLAVDWGYLSRDCVQRVLREQRADERFGECARRLGLLSVFQHYALIGRQRGMQQPIGQWFVQAGLCTDAQLCAWVEDLKVHNRRYWQ